MNIIPIPAYLFGDVELAHIINTATEVQSESDTGAPELTAVILHAKLELQRRDKPWRAVTTTTRGTKDGLPAIIRRTQFTQEDT